MAACGLQPHPHLEERFRFVENLEFEQLRELAGERKIKRNWPLLHFREDTNSWYVYANVIGFKRRNDPALNSFVTSKKAITRAEHHCDEEAKRETKKEAFNAYLHFCDKIVLMDPSISFGDGNVEVQIPEALFKEAKQLLGDKNRKQATGECGREAALCKGPHMVGTFLSKRGATWCGDT